MQRTMKRIGALILALAMLVTFMPTLGLAENAHAAVSSIKVKLTVNNKGVIAQDKDGEAMVEREVTVLDIDSDGQFTFDEALVAAHKKYHADGETAYGAADGAVNKLWGVSTGNTLFYINDEGIPNGVTADTVQEGDSLYASINKDDVLYDDWFTKFDETIKTVDLNTDFELNIKGHLGMAYEAEDKEFVSLDDIQIGTWDNGEFKAIEGAVTDKDGKATLSFDQPGTYLVTAGGTTSQAMSSKEIFDGIYMPFTGMIMNYQDTGKDLWGKMDWGTGDMLIGYTEEDYGDGPYPYEEIKWLDMYEFDQEEEFEDGYLMYSGDYIYDCPIMAPYCIVKVLPDPIEVTMTVNNKGILASDKDGEAMVERPVTVTDADEDTILTFHDALVAAHKEYYPDGEAGYDPGSGFVDKLWGNESTNNLFYINDEGLPNGVTVDTVAEGDRLYASVNADNMFYSDWFSKFKSSKKTVTAGEDFTLDLTGHKGMAFTEDEKTFVPLSGIKVGTWDNGAFNEIEDAVTDDNGKAVLSFAEPGTYIVTANGMVKGTVSDWKLIDLSNNQGWPYGTIDSDAFEYNVAYTDKDYGDGPYPVDEVKYIDFFEEADEESDNVYAWQDLHYLKSNQ